MIRLSPTGTTSAMVSPGFTTAPMAWTLMAWTTPFRGCADFHPFEHVAGDGELLLDVGDTRPDLGELLQHRLALALARLLEKKARFFHRLLEPLDVAADHADLALEAIAFALEAAHARRGDELLLERGVSGSRSRTS